jgi:hypothetical protein
LLLYTCEGSVIMPTIEEEKHAKPRQRSRKAEPRKAKSKPKAEARPDSVSPIAAAIEAAPVEPAPLAIAVESAPEEALSGEVLAPEIRELVPQTAGARAIAQAYDDYTRKSWAASRLLVERLIAARSLNEALEIQGEFAKQSCANFVAQSQKICELYSAWAQQFFRPFDQFAAQWTRTGRDRGSHTLH